MNESKHTPGPWHFRQSFTDGEPSAYEVDAGAPGRFNVCTVAAGAGQVETEEANARLIAAAPDMLHALELAKAELDKMGCEHDCESMGPNVPLCPVCAVTAAIKKATSTGESGGMTEDEHNAFPKGRWT
jgi:hypothetical protein